MDLDSLRLALREFVSERDWEQFHSPKNLATALAVEAAELMEPFQWLTQAESRQLQDTTLVSVRDELADVLIYTVRLADVLGIDLLEAAGAKLDANRHRYPASLVKGSAKKASEY